jgi:CubicO group peptidase (beta-lactamase class C family)
VTIPATSQAKIDIDAPIQKYVPNYPVHEGDVEQAALPITPRMLAAHTSGIRHYQGMEFYIKEKYPTVDEAMKIFKSDPLKKRPGESWLYSTHAYTLLAAAIESASNSNFLDFMQEHIFKRAGMVDTRPDTNDDISMFRPRYYMRKPVLSAEDDEKFQKGQLIPPQPKPEGRIPRSGVMMNPPSPWALRNAPFVDNSWKWAGGGFVATARGSHR